MRCGAPSTCVVAGAAAGASILTSFSSSRSSSVTLGVSRRDARRDATVFSRAAVYYRLGLPGYQRRALRAAILHLERALLAMTVAAAADARKIYVHAGMLHSSMYTCLFKRALRR